MTAASDISTVPRVLVAEDDVAVRTFVTRSLTHAGFSVTDVEDGQQALQALEIERFDLLVADIVMPVRGRHSAGAERQQPPARPAHPADNGLSRRT